ncbi:phosphate ABC transporter permease subunit PstC [Stenomitos frigidus]|uniref:Phosphate transport system permease protein n=1 Tax=Stenomitos frigidus ULC18 TaxID=2107698 RepID=A0A2T1DWS6_9CYAN|nr:phosphate ABC transporter permease subunit PstC [Stenomitos frigidus]PSB24834.1 phosphate ABC transporter permease subunit PstC [Stenomitos frigidus ULC18]
MSSAEPPQSASAFSANRSTTADRSDDIMATDGMASWANQGFLWLTRGFALITVLILLWMGWVIFQQAQPAIKEFGFGFLTSQEWDIANVKFGALPYIFGTVVTSTVALVLALPIGLAVALITSENFLPPWVRSPIAFLVELIAAIPSVIIGLWGIYLLVPSLQPIQLWLYAHFKQIPLFSTQPFGSGMLAAGVILAIMILPTIAAISREVLMAIPTDLRAASMSLGATRWETIFGVILPASVSGILGAAMLGLGRALGETMAVTMVIGNSAQISPSLFNVGYTIPALLANEFGEALDPLHIGSLMYLALILFALTLAINVVAILMVRVLGYGK